MERTFVKEPSIAAESYLNPQMIITALGQEIKALFCIISLRATSQKEFNTLGLGSPLKPSATRLFYSQPVRSPFNSTGQTICFSAHV